ncbi:hypothetical protein ACIRQQ_12910 [Streptomyces fuscichromogenes]|uniref:hypothetical protein n=1 Tax=Streptomyces fuscichromogenes TaxID=1324013 RepID=UPI0037F4CC0E
MSDDFSGETGPKRKAGDGGDTIPPKRLKTERSDSDEESEDKHSTSEEYSSEEYPGQPVGDFVPEDEPSSESQSSQETRADLEYLAVFIRTAAAWAEANEGRIDRICKTAGGWESWLEVELYLALEDAGVQVSRQPPFSVNTTGGSRADLFLGNRFLVEIKVETATEPAAAFAKRVKTDIDKVDAKAKDSPASVVGFAWSKESTAACTKLIGAPTRAGLLRIFHDASLGS